jgi:hypothetical protein
MLADILSYLPAATTVFVAIVAFVAAIAPLTKSDLDNKLLKVLVFFHDLLVRFVPNAASAPKNRVVRDHRTSP